MPAGCKFRPKYNRWCPGRISVSDQNCVLQSVFFTLRSVGSLDWQFSNVTADSTYQFVGPELGLEEDLVQQHKVFEMRGTTTYWPL